MADTGAPKKKTPASTTKAAKPRKQSATAAAAGVTPPHGDELRDQIARRAYEISQGHDAGSEEENWLRAERELSDR